MAKTLPLDPATWDLVLDANGNWNLAEEDYSIAQGVASAVQTYAGECWYNNTLGMPYFNAILGQLPPASLVVSNIRTQAMRIDGVEDIRVVSLRLNGRKLTGTILIDSDISDSTLVASF